MGDWCEDRLGGGGESAGTMTRGEAGTMAQTSGEEGAMRMQMRLQILMRVRRTLVSLHVGGCAGAWVDLRPSPMDSGMRLGRDLCPCQGRHQEDESQNWQGLCTRKPAGA